MKKKIVCLFLVSLMLVGCGASDTGSTNGMGFNIDATRGDAPSSSTSNSSFFNFGNSKSDSSTNGEDFVIDIGDTNETSDSYVEDFSEDNFNADLDTDLDDSSDGNFEIVKEKGFYTVAKNPLSTFSADVDTGSYCAFRSAVLQEHKDNENGDYYYDDSYYSSILNDMRGTLRLEECLNYFDYSVTNKSDGMFSVQYDVQECPWNRKNDLLLMTVRANRTELKNKGNNFVYLIDTSGSMDETYKINLAVTGLSQLTTSLTKNDTVSIVTYADDSRVLLIAKGNEHEKINKCLEDVLTLCKEFGGGTNGSGGIEAAYKCAMDNFIDNGNNRVIIVSDGDMNLGVTSTDGLENMIKEYRNSGIFLTTTGFGDDNYSDVNMEHIADLGNGNYHYIDTVAEARRVFLTKFKQTTVTVAKDVKFQAEFNKDVVSRYRLLGYENRGLTTEDFADDTKDGGEVGADQQVTVMYELEYTNGAKPTKDNILKMAIRYKAPQGSKSLLEEYNVKKNTSAPSKDWNLAAGVSEMVMLFNNSEYKGTSTYDNAMDLVKKSNNEYAKELCDIMTVLKATK